MDPIELISQRAHGQRPEFGKAKTGCHNPTFLRPGRASAHGSRSRTRQTPAEDRGASPNPAEYVWQTPGKGRRSGHLAGALARSGAREKAKAAGLIPRLQAPRTEGIRCRACKKPLFDDATLPALQRRRRLVKIKCQSGRLSKSRA